MEIKIELNTDNLTEQEQEALNELIEKAQRPKSKKWKPKKDEKYYYIDSDVVVESYSNQFNDEDNRIFSIGNYFKTEQEAKNMIEKLKVIEELKCFAAENNEGDIDWGNGEQAKYYIYYNHNINELCFEGNFTWQSNDIYFASEKIAEKASQTIGADRIKRYLFGVCD